MSYKKFVTAVLDPIKEVFVIYIVFQALSLKILIYPARAAQIASVIFKKVAIPNK